MAAFEVTTEEGVKPGKFRRPALWETSENVVMAEL